MTKPTTVRGYSDQHTANCERVLVTLLRGLGPWKESVYLVGGLTPRFLVRANPSTIPAHVGTLDVDIIVDLQILTDTEGYHTLEENLQRMGFERSTNDSGKSLSWRWLIDMGHNELIFVELLTDSQRLLAVKLSRYPRKEPSLRSTFHTHPSSSIYTKLSRFGPSFLEGQELLSKK